MRPTAHAPLALLAALLSTACSRELGVPAKNPLAIEPPSRTLAPRQQLTFTSRGGAGGYTFRFHGGVAGSSAESLKASLDPATGAYQAGPVGPATDVVEVVDRAGSLASATITIGPQLTLTPGAVYPPPGGGATLVAHGGLPPYDYAFVPRSNRSGGSVDHVTGVYSAGGNPGTIDLIQVTDAAGAVSQVSLGIVGSRQVAVPGGAAAIEVGDLNGDGLEDLLFLAPDVGGARRLSTWSFPRGSAPLADTYWTPAGTAALGVWDLEGSGRSDVAVVGPIITVLRADLGGTLSLAGPLPTPASGNVATGPWFANGGPCVASRLAWGVSGPVVPTACPPSVLPQPSGAPQAMATGNFAGAGGPDVAWVEGYFLVGPSQTKINDPKIRFGLANDTSPTPLTLPSVVGSPGTSADVKLIGGAPLTQQIARVPTGTAAGDGAVVLMANVPTGSPATPAAANLLGYIPPFAATPAWAGWTPFDPFPGQSPTMGVAGCGPLGPDRLPSAVAWNGGIAVTVADLSATTVRLAQFLADQYPVGVAACADVDGDGFPDLITASADTDTATVWLGEGDGRFGQRPRYAVTGALAVGDVDGDGVPDLVEATGTPGLRVLFGSDHKLGLGPETAVQVPPDLLVVGPFGTAADVVFQGASGGLYLVPGNGDGTFGTAQILRPPGLAMATSHLDGLVPAELGGTAPGLDLLGWTLKYTVPPRVVGPYYTVTIVAIIRNLEGVTLVEGGGSSGNGLDVQPVDVDGDGHYDSLATLHGGILGTPVVPGLQLDTFLTVASGPAWTSHAFAASVSGTVKAAGAAGDVAVFLAGGQLWLASPRGLTAASSPLAGAVSGRLGRLTAGAPFPELVLADGQGRLVGAHGQDDGQGRLGGFSAGFPIASAPGVLTAVVPLSWAPGAAPADILLRTGDALVPVVPDGAGGWH